mgnify:CR=1 FL=1
MPKISETHRRIDQLALGSATAPAITSPLDPDTGLYWIGAGELGVSVDGAVRMSLTSAQMNMQNLPVVNIGAAGTDFSATGALTLAAILTVSAGGINVTGGIGNAVAPVANAITAFTTVTGGAAVTSLSIDGNVTGGAAAQRDLVFRTGDAANPQVLATRLTIGSNAATAVATWVNITHTGITLSGALDANNQVITNIGAAGTDFSATGGLTLAAALVVTDNGITINGANGVFTMDITGASPLIRLYRSGTELVRFTTALVGTNGGRLIVATKPDGGALASTWVFSAPGDFEAATDDTGNIGTASTRPRSANFSRQLTIGGVAVAAGTVALTISQGAHTALAAEVLTISVPAVTLTLADTTTIALARAISVGGITYAGVAAGGAEVVTTAITLEVGLPVQGANLTITNMPVAIRALGSIIIGSVTPPAAGPTNTLIIGSGTAPTSSPADSVTLYSSDESAGHTVPSFYAEGTNVLLTGQADSVSSRRFQVRVNGTLIQLLAV